MRPSNKRFSFPQTIHLKLKKQFVAMRILCCIALCVALSDGAELKQTRETFEERIGRMEAGMHRMSIQFDSMVRSVARISKHLKIEKDENKPAPTDNGTEINKLAKRMNDSDLEERVSVLEMQMVGVLSDIETIEGDQSVQDYRLDEAEGEIETIQADVTSIQETITVLVANDEICKVPLPIWNRPIKT